MAAGETQQTGLIRRANAWLEEIAAPADWRLADLKGYTDRGQALVFFRDEFGFNDLFGIAILADGDSGQRRRRGPPADRPRRGEPARRRQPAADPFRTLEVLTCMDWKP